MSDSLKYTVIKQAGRKCPFCDKAVEALDSRGLPYSLRALPREELINAAKEANMTTVPIVYHGKKLLGGYNELLTYLVDTQ